MQVWWIIRANLLLATHMAIASSTYAPTVYNNVRYCLIVMFIKRNPNCNPHISPVLRQLHWLPVRQRVVSKTATLVHWSLSGNTPGYLADDCPLVADARVRQLRSADTPTLVSWTRNSFGDRTFAAAGPKVWNNLPPNLRLCGLSYGQFRLVLKTFLFGQWGHSAVWTASNCAKQKYSYLLTYLHVSSNVNIVSLSCR